MKNTLRIAELVNFSGLVLLLPYCAALGQSNTNAVNGEKNQTAGSNSGVMVQNNITVTNITKKILKTTAKTDFGDEDGWLRVLVPAREALPPVSCEVAPNSLTVLLGKTNITSCPGNSCTIIYDPSSDKESKDLLSVKRSGNSILINATVLDENGKIVTVLNNNMPHMNKNNAFEWRRPDGHTLDVIDQKDRNVLHIRFLNKNTIYIEGIFFTSKGYSIVVKPDEIDVNNPPGSPGQMVLSETCAASINKLFRF